MAGSVSLDTRYVSFTVCECSRPALVIVGSASHRMLEAGPVDAAVVSHGVVESHRASNAELPALVTRDREFS